MREHEAHRRRTLWLVGVLHAFTHLYGVALLPLYLSIQRDLNLGSVEQATLLVTAMGLAYFLPSYPLGVLADRLSRKGLLASGLTLNAAGMVGLALAPNYAWAITSVVVAGIGGSFFHPSATALIARLFPERRGRALGLVGIGASFGFCFGPLYCGWRAVVSGSWRTPLLEIGVLGLVCAGLFVWLADEEREQAPTAGADLSSRGPVPPMFPSAVLWMFFIGMSLLFSLRDFAGSAMATTSSLFLQNAHGLNPKFAGLVLSGIFIMSAISNPLFGHFSDRGRIRWLVLVLLVAAGFMSVLPRVPVAWATPVLLIYGFFFMASYPITEAALMEAVPDAVRGRVFGLFITLSGLVGNVSHWAVGNWVERLGPRSSEASSYIPLFALVSFLVVMSLGALPFLHGIRKREQVACGSGPGPLAPQRSPD